jgi:hypothetical protein
MTEINATTAHDEAVAYVISRGYSPQAAAVIVNKQTPEAILAGRDAEEAADEETVQMQFDRPVLLTVRAGKTIAFNRGINLVPKRLANHWYLKAHGVKPSEAQVPVVSEKPNPDRARAIAFLVSRGQTPESAQATVDAEGTRVVLAQAEEAAKADAETLKGGTPAAKPDDKKSAKADAAAKKNAGGPAEPNATAGEPNKT